MPGEAADAAAAPSPPDLLPAPALTHAGAVTDLLAEPLVAADIGMVEAPPPVVIPYLPILDHEERVAVVAEGRPSMSTTAVPDASAVGGPDALVEGRVEPWPILGSSGLIPAQLNPNEWCGQPLLFWSHDTSDPEPLLSLNDELEERSRDNFREYIKAAMRLLRSTMEILSRDVPRVFQVRIRHTPCVTRAFFVISCFPSSGTCGRKHRQVAVHPSRERRLGFVAVPVGRAYRGQ
jgi:hypothetical protein